MPLSMLKVGENGSIKRINGKDEHKNFLCTLGFTIGEDVSIISENRGNFIVCVKDVRIAIDRTMATRIMV